MTSPPVDCVKMNGNGPLHLRAKDAKQPLTLCGTGGGRRTADVMPWHLVRDDPDRLCWKCCAVLGWHTAAQRPL